MADTNLSIVASEDLQTLSNDVFVTDVLNGLSMPQKAIPARYFYDHRGSELFEQITELPEYYPTRVEVALMKDVIDDLAAQSSEDVALVEFGAGSLSKVGLLLERLSVSHYVPIDISGEFLRESAERIAHEYPDITVMPVEADFSRHVDLPGAVDTHPKLGFFPGSTLGNLVLSDAVDLLRRMRGSLGNGARLLIGLDRIKDLDTLIPAYDDASGTTAAFNLNLLKRINRELDGTFDLDAFKHQARWNADASRIEMHLVATADTRFSVAGEAFSLAKGESIHTENSHKYSAASAETLLRASGWRSQSRWTDDGENFFLILAEAMDDHVAP